MIDFQKFLTNFKIAASALKIAFRKEQSFRIQVLIGIIVIIFMIILRTTSLEKAILTAAILVVLSLELVNSQIEKILDLIQPALHPKVKLIKDLSAGAVLVSVLGAIIIGILIFSPYLLGFFK